jgi:hypothetical protein
LGGFLGSWLPSCCHFEKTARQEKDVHVSFSPLTSDWSISRLSLYNPLTEWPSPFGSKLGPYEIVAAIGAGGMGEVYRAKDTRLGRDVAIKVLPEALVVSFYPA